MEPFCTAEEYEARFGEAEDPDALAAVLSDASLLISCECRASGVDAEAPELAEALSYVCRHVAFRSLGAGSDAPFGATQYSAGVVGISESYTLANPYRDMFLTKPERRMLGIGRARAGFAAIGGPE
ncbi:hypothetical protein GMI70_02865 [Eggerthellaceae bacterium zg-893]|nr:hypothetical protein [Eggerthellaceae bacterium zg-893]